MIENLGSLKLFFFFRIYIKKNSHLEKVSVNVCILKEVNVLFQTNGNMGVIIKIFGEVNAIFSPLFFMLVFSVIVLL